MHQFSKSSPSLRLPFAASAHGEKNKTPSGALTAADPNNGLKLHTRWRKINRRLFQLARAQKSLFFSSRRVCGCRVESQQASRRFVSARESEKETGTSLARDCAPLFHHRVCVCGCARNKSAHVGCTTATESRRTQPACQG